MRVVDLELKFGFVFFGMGFFYCFIGCVSVVEVVEIARERLLCVLG